MPTLTRWFIKSALLYFVVSLLVGAALAGRALLALPAFVAGLMPVYFHLFMVGWVTQMIFGVAYWMFPRYSKERPRRSESLARATYVALNAGLVSRAAAEPLAALRAGSGWEWVLVASAGLQWLAGLGFVINTWGRVKER